MNTYVRLPVIAVAAVIAMGDLRAQTSSTSQTPGYFQTFLDHVPTDSDVSMLPPHARDVVVPKVRLVERLRYLVGRDQSGRPPPLPKDLFYARLEIVEALAGQAQVGKRYGVYFGTPGGGSHYKFPHAPHQIASEYFVTMFLDEDGQHRLLPASIEQKEYQDWQSGILHSPQRDLY